jgi:hypothetical protein
MFACNAAKAENCPTARRSSASICSAYPLGHWRYERMYLWYSAAQSDFQPQRREIGTRQMSLKSMDRWLIASYRGEEIGYA